MDMPGETAPPKTSFRFRPFDRLRYLMITLVVMQHAAASYGKLVPWWMVRDPYPSFNPFFDWLRLLPDVITMPVLFFLAGFFALPSLRQKGVGRFLRGKCTLLLGPWLVCVTLVVPIIHYIYHVSRADSYLQKGYFSYWAFFLQDTTRFHVGFTESFEHFNQNFTWFLSLLFFFFLFFAVSHAFKRKLTTEKTFDPRQHLPLAGKSANLLSAREKNHAVNEKGPNDGPALGHYGSIPHR
jgi:hypothetical protein